MIPSTSESIGDLYGQLADLQEKLAKALSRIDTLEENVESLENWRVALRIRVRQEKAQIL